MTKRKIVRSFVGILAVISFESGGLLIAAPEVGEAGFPALADALEVDQVLSEHHQQHYTGQDDRQDKVIG